MKGAELVALMVFLRTDDIELHAYAKDAIEKEYPAGVFELITKYLAKEGTAKKKSQEFMSELTALENVDIDSCIEITESFQKAAKAHMRPLPTDLIMGTVMKMYRSGDERLVKKAKEVVIKGFEKFVHKIIHKYYSTYAIKYGEELFQCGCIGLMKAMENYDSSYFKFNTYCTTFVLHEISGQINFQNNDSTVHFNNIQKKINTAISEIKDEGFTPSVEKIAIVSELQPEVIEREMDYIERTRFKYLDADECKEDIGEYDATPEALFAKKEREKSLFGAIMDLPKEYREIVVMKCNDYTNEQIASSLDITIGKAKTKYQKALQMMKRNPKLYETFSDYYSEATVHMARYSVSSMMPQKLLKAQMDDLMECVGGLNENDGAVYYVDSSDSMGQLRFSF